MSYWFSISLWKQKAKTKPKVKRKEEERKSDVSKEMESTIVFQCCCLATTIDFCTNSAGKEDYNLKLMQEIDQFNEVGLEFRSNHREILMLKFNNLHV